ncbi:nicotinate phosphoribosyltransferase / putative serine/threonine protein phosphatase [Acinetobacter phage AB1I1M-1]
MSNVLFLGDLHAGHKSITKYRTQFRDELDHFEYVEEQYHKRVTKRDKCIFTGDAVFSLDRAKRIAKWPGIKELCLGNHDTDNVSMKDLIWTFDEIYSLRKYKEFWISHAPIHPDELRGKRNIHGHVHYQNVQDLRYFNTSLENIGFKPISLHEIRVIMDRRNQSFAKKGYHDVDLDIVEFKR